MPDRHGGLWCRAPCGPVSGESERHGETTGRLDGSCGTAAPGLPPRRRLQSHPGLAAS